MRNPFTRFLRRKPKPNVCVPEFKQIDPPKSKAPLVVAGASVVGAAAFLLTSNEKQAPTRKHESSVPIERPAAPPPPTPTPTPTHSPRLPAITEGSRSEKSYKEPRRKQVRTEPECGTVSVRGYTDKHGRRVPSHTRRKPCPDERPKSQPKARKR